MPTMRWGVAAVLAAAGGAMGQETLYGLANPISASLRRLDPATGGILEFHAVTGQQALFGGLAEAAGVLYSIDGYNDENPDRFFRIDPVSGGGSVVGETGFNWNFRCVTRNPATGVMYATTDNRLHTVNLSTGVATLVADVTAPPQLDQMTAMAIDLQGRAYFTDIGSTDLFSLDLGTGQGTWIASVGGSNNWFEDLAFDGAGVLWGCRLSGGVYTIDLATGQPTFRFSGNYNGLVFVSTAQPCYPNCDGSTGPAVLNVNDFVCFQTRFAAAEPYADCNHDTSFNVNDFVCFQQAFAAGCP